MRCILVMVAAFVALVGCDSMAPQKKGELSPKQKSAWEEKRKEVADYPYMVVGYDADEKVWMTCIYSDPKLVKYDWKRLSVDLWHKDDKESARELAKQKADNPSIATTAVVDLVGGEEPKAIRWFFKQGDMMKSSNGAPRPDLGVSLKQYLRFVEENPGMVKIPEQ